MFFHLRNYGPWTMVTVNIASEDLYEGFYY